MKHKSFLKRHITSILMASFHFVLFLIHLQIFFSWGVKDGILLSNADLLFLPMMVLDLPLFLIFKNLISTQAIFSQSIFSSALNYTIIFGILGTAYWYGIGHLIQKGLAKVKSRKPNP